MVGRGLSVLVELLEVFDEVVNPLTVEELNHR
jgi:hypothetical protein